jgi:hypothetical protein
VSADALSKEDTEGTENDLERREKLFTAKGAMKEARRWGGSGGNCGLNTEPQRHIRQRPFCRLQFQISDDLFDQNRWNDQSEISCKQREFVATEHLQNRLVENEVRPDS